MIEGLIEKLRIALHERRHAYQKVFAGPLGEKVLKDLARFCRAHETTGHVDPRMAAVLDGRREVWLRIQQHLQLSPQQLWSLYSGREEE